METEVTTWCFKCNSTIGNRENVYCEGCIEGFEGKIEELKKENADLENSISKLEERISELEE